MSDFPRGWTVNNYANGSGTLAITIPGVPGVVRVLDVLTAKAVNFAGAAFISILTVNVGLSSLLATGTPTPSIDVVSFSDLNLSSVLGGALVVSLSATLAAGQWQDLTLQGHDI